MASSDSIQDSAILTLLYFARIRIAIGDMLTRTERKDRL